MNKLHIMVDLETASLNPNARILTIGAVCINNLDDQFYKRIKYVDFGPFESNPDTLLWWNNQDPAVREEAFSGEVLLRDALEDFCKWFPGDAIFWCKGLDFDMAILKFALSYYGIKNPWHYRNKMCMQTIKRLFGYSWEATKLGAHHALTDAIHQAQQVREFMKEHPEFDL